MTNTYHTKHRPADWAQVQGQAGAKAALKKALDEKTSQVFLLEGPSGCGKTTLARIASTYAGATEHDILEVDAATYSGAEETRKLQESMSYRPIGGGKVRVCIVDECHGLSQKAWDTLLKTIEEPNAAALWFFCTTNPSKVPRTIKTRCTPIKLALLSDRELEAIVNRVVKKEKLDVSESAMAVIITESYGCGRQALQNLAVAKDASTRKEAKALLNAAAESDATRELCQFLLKGGSWPRCMEIVARLDTNYEGIRIIVCNYMGAVLKNSKSDDSAANTLGILEAWSTPYNVSEGIAPLMLSIGRTLLAE